MRFWILFVSLIVSSSICRASNYYKYKSASGQVTLTTYELSPQEIKERGLTLYNSEVNTPRVPQSAAPASGHSITPYTTPSVSGRPPSRPPIKKDELSSEELPMVVTDPPTAEALKAFNEKTAEIGKACRRPEDNSFAEFLAKVDECSCAHLPELLVAIQRKIDAFGDLLNRHPELDDQMIKIEGVFGNWFLSKKDVKKKTLEELRKESNCR